MELKARYFLETLIILLVFGTLLSREEPAVLISVLINRADMIHACLNYNNCFILGICRSGIETK